MKGEIIFEKKALSEIIAYVLLIIIAISLSLLVYAWLKGYILHPTKECPDGTSLVVGEYYCNSTSKNLSMTFLNKGLFNIDGFVIKASNKIGKLPTLQLTGDDGSYFIYFPGDNGLEPNARLSQEFSYALHGQVVEVEIIPFKTIKGEDLLCNKATIRQEIDGCV